MKEGRESEGDNKYCTDGISIVYVYFVFIKGGYRIHPRGEGRIHNGADLVFKGLFSNHAGLVSISLLSIHDGLVFKGLLLLVLYS